jgi:Rod binding domain-containing protein
MAATLAPTLTPAATAALAFGIDRRAAMEAGGKARAVAEEFEAVFLNSMFQQMFANIGQGPFSGGPGASIWRSFLTDEYAKSFAKAGGIGLADQVQRTLLTLQEAR